MAQTNFVGMVYVKHSQALPLAQAQALPLAPVAEAQALPALEDQAHHPVLREAVPLVRAVGGLVLPLAILSKKM